MSDNMDVKSALYAHKNNVRNLNEKHQNELEKIKVNHTKSKNQLSNQHTQELINDRNNNHKEIIQQAHKHEEVLGKMRDGLEQVKETTQKREADVSQNLEKKLSHEKNRFQEKLTREKTTQELALEEMNQKANIELQRLQRQMEMKEHELKHSGKLEIENQKARANTELSMNKQTYSIKKNAAEDKYQSALRQQTKVQTDTLTSEERKFQKALLDRTGSYQQEIKKVKSDGDNKKAMAQALFEKNFRELLQKHEGELSELSGKKERIVQKMKNEITEAYSLEAGRASDPFYTTTTLDPQVEEIDNAYLIRLKVDEADAGNVTINGHERKLTLAMNRRFENVREEEGSTEKLRKVETLTKSFTVSDIVDVNKVEKSYEEGTLTFKVAKA